MDKNNDIFANKLDQNYIKIHSDSYFFEIFDKKKKKCEIIIPDTLILERKTIKSWYFNSKTTNQPKILKKNSDKLNVIFIAKHFSGYKFNEEGYRILQQIKGLLTQCPEVDKRLSMFVKFQNGKSQEFILSDFIGMMTDNKVFPTVKMVQQVVHSRTNQNEVFYCEFRVDNFRLPSKQRFFKKIVTTKEKKTTNNQGVDFDQDIQDEQETEEKKENETFTEIKYFKCFDNQVNQKLQKKTIQIIDFVEQSYKIKIRKIVTKFIVDSQEVINYIGMKEMYIDLDPNKIIDANLIIQDLKYSDTIFFSVLTQYMKDIKQKKFVSKNYKTFIQNFDKKKIEKTQYSQQLLNKMIIEKCKGDFCEYLIWNNMQDALAIRQTIQDEYKNQFEEMVNNNQEQSVKLPFEISNQLLLRVRESPSEILALMEVNKIFHRSQFNRKDNKVLNNEKFNDHRFLKFKKMVDNIEQLYKRVKICKNCFIVYSLAQKAFETGFKQTMKKLPENYWKTNNLLYQREMENKKPLYAMTGNKLKRSKTQDSGRRFFRVLQLPDVSTINKEKLEQKALTSINLTEKSNNNIKSRAYLQSAQIQRPKNSIQSAKLKNNQAISLQRLTMGFMNYESAKRLYSSKARLTSETNDTEQDQKRKATNLFDYFNLKPKLNLVFKGDKKDSTNNNKLQKQNTIKYNSQQLEEPKKKEEKIKQTISYYHQSNQCNHLRKLNHFQKISPLQPFFDDQRIQSAPIIDLAFIIKHMAYPQIENTAFQEMEVFVYDEYTAIPYILLHSQGVYLEDQPQQFYVFFHDIFDSFTEYYYLIQDIIKNQSNITFLFFNIPGQAYTLYNHQKVFSNFQIVDILDKLLYHLDCSNQIPFQKVKLNLIGIGFGGFLLQTFSIFIILIYQLLLVIFAHGMFKNLERIILINSFTRLDNNLQSVLSKSSETFQGCPDNLPELPYKFFSILMNSTEIDDNKIQDKISNNPIQRTGRLFLIKMFQGSNYIKDRFMTLECRLDAYHSMNNCVININHVEELTRGGVQGGSQRNKYIINGKHSLIDDDQEELRRILQVYLFH